MQKVNYIPLENILADDPYAKNKSNKEGWIFDHRGGCQFTFFINVILA